MLKFTTELAVLAHPEERKKRYGAALAEIEAMSIPKIKAAIASAEQGMQMAQMTQMYTMHQMQARFAPPCLAYA